ncbi:MAG: LytR C-terminal domain-containing protein, partial [Acidimicrobiales bacterium]
VTVSVENGTGATNQATDTGDSLQALGFHVVGLGDTNPVGPISETYVYYAHPQDEAAAEKVAQSMSGDVVMGLGPTTDGADVTVVTGSYFAVLPPATTTTTATAPGSSTTQATTAPPTTSVTSPSSSASSQIDPPSSNDQPLAPFDPRACTASGGEGS